MIVDIASTIPNSQAESLTWLRLRRFKNVPFTTNFLMELHQLPSNGRGNAKKQAEQIRFCLIQAEEYFTAARAVTLATKPLLAYYGVMSFALAEILLKQSGDSSLDRARSEHAHHGLVLKQSRDPSKCESLVDSASALSAAPMINGILRQGTFELWHQSAREAPAVGKRTTVYSSNTEEGSDLLFTPNDHRLKLIPSGGRTLLSVMNNLPGMEQVLSEANIPANSVRASGSSRLDRVAQTLSSTLIIHPTDSSTLDRVLSLFTFSPNSIPSTNIEKLARGYKLDWFMSPNSSLGKTSFPQPFQSYLDQMRFSTEESLNECGLIYMGMYILGNYARYFPDQWMREVESASALSLAASTLVDIALERAPFLTMCELGRVWYFKT